MTESFPTRYPRWGTAVLRPVLGLALLAVVSACGGGSSPKGAAATAPSAAATAGTQQRPGTSGTLAAINGTSLEVQNPQTGQVTVTYTSSTAFSQTVKVTAATVKAGDCVTAVAPTGTASGAAFTARTVTITAPVSGRCTAGGAGGGAGFGGANRTGTPRASASPRPRRTGGTGAGAGRGFGGAFGQVKSVSGASFVVQDTARNGGTATTTTVTVGSSTTIEQTAKATSGALAVGKCVTAIGKADDTGAVTATSISIRPATAQGCTTTGFGGRGFGGGGNGGGGGGGGNGGGGANAAGGTNG